MNNENIPAYRDPTPALSNTRYSIISNAWGIPLRSIYIVRLIYLIYLRNLHFRISGYFRISTLLNSKSPILQFSVLPKSRFAFHAFRLLGNSLFQNDSEPSPDLPNSSRLSEIADSFSPFTSPSEMVGRFLQISPCLFPRAFCIILRSSSQPLSISLNSQNPIPQLIFFPSLLSARIP